MILHRIGNAFADLRESGGRSEAWAQFQSGVMRNLDTLAPSGTASLDVCVTIALKIEDFLKSEQAHGKAPGDLFADWLKGSQDAAA